MDPIADLIPCSVQIGNSDDKLTQSEWSEFCFLTQQALKAFDCSIHFYGLSVGDAKWQNACWCFCCKQSELQELKIVLVSVREKFKQDSIAFLEGSTEFI